MKFYGHLRNEEKITRKIASVQSFDATSINPSKPNQFNQTLSTINPHAGLI
jgi:hypothetical protein